MAYRQVDLDRRGLDYVLRHLRGVNRLCDGLVRVVETVQGQVFTILPDDTHADRIYDFERGGMLRENLDMARAIPIGDGQGVLAPVADLAIG